MKVRTGLTAAICICLTACGLSVTDEERVDRAMQYMEDDEYRSAMIELKNALLGNPDNAEAHLLLAEVNLGIGDLPGAENELSRAIDLASPEESVRPLQFEIMAAQGRYTDMLAALGQEPGGMTDEQKLEYRGIALLATGRNDVAQETYEEWLRLNPQAVDARIGLARAQAALGDLSSARETIESVLAADDSLADAWLTLGSILVMQADQPSAIDAFEKALGHSPAQRYLTRRANIQAALADAQLLAGRTDDARRSIERLQGMAPASPVTLFLAARLAQAENDHAMAARHLQTLLKDNPTSIRARVLLADMQMRQGYTAQAEQLLERVIADAPDNLYARRLLAEIRLRRSEPDRAMDVLAPALDSGTDSPELYSLSAQIRFEQGDIAQALIDLESASRTAPDDVAARLNLALGHILAKQYDAAVEILEPLPAGVDGAYIRERLLVAAYWAMDQEAKAEALKDSVLAGSNADPAAHIFAASYALESGNADAARQILESAVSRFGASANLSVAIAVLDLQEGRMDSARSHFEMARTRDPENLNALVGLARIASASGEVGTMQQFLENAIAGHPTAVQPRVLLANSYVRSGRRDSALDLAREAIRLGVRDGRLNAMLGDVFRDAGLLDEALFQYQAAVTKLPDVRAAKLSLAQTLLALDRSNEARQALTEIVASGADDFGALVSLALVDLRLGHMAEAQQSIDRLGRIDQEHPATLALQGEILFQQKHYAESADAFRRAAANGAGQRAVLREHLALVEAASPDASRPLADWLARNPNDTVVRIKLAEHYQVTGQGQQAIREYERVTAADPKNAVALNNLAWQYQQEGDAERAVQLAEQAMVLNSASASIADTLGWIYRDLGRLADSEKTLRRASQLAPSNSEYAFHLATVLAESGKRSEAKAILEAILKSDAGFASRRDAEILSSNL